jgi:ornithine cyclodeaminase/alanine dehydrogenase-like protein (mu-crystallin family)
MQTNEIRVLSAKDIRAALPMAEAIEVMRSLFVQLSHAAVKLPPRQHLSIAEHAGVALFMPAYLPESGHLGVKVVTLHERNASAGLPRIQGLVMLFDATSGRPSAVLDGAGLTALRTGAASGVATDVLARAAARRVAILGAGVQARTQLEAVCAVRPVAEVRVFDLSAERARAYALEVGEELGLNVEPVGTAADAVRNADVICAATNASSPAFADSDLPVGVHINAIGSYQPTVQEVPTETVVRARVVVDHRESALAETGDLIIPIRQGRFSPERISAELGEIIAGEQAGRQTDEEVTLFKSVGLAAQDVAAAARAVSNAASQGLGTVVSL